MVKRDLLILGGGPAGGMTALLAARAGMSVELCEAHATLPARVCGMYLCPAGVGMLQRLGIRERVGGNARKLHGMVLVAPNLHRLVTHFPLEGDVPDHGLALERPSLDAAFLDLAREAGASIRMGTRPEHIERCENGWRAMIPGDEAIHARVLVGADGRKSSTARMLGLSLPARRSRTAIHIDLPALGEAPALGQMHVFDDGAYVGLNPVTPDRVNFSLVCDPGALRGITVVDFVNDHLARSPHLSDLLQPLPVGTKPGVTFPTSARVRCASTHDAALVGDASGYTDPLTGEGIYGAMWTAEALFSALETSWPDIPSALARYAAVRQRQQRAKTGLCELFQLFIRRPLLANSVHWLLSRRQSVADSFIGIVGNTYSPARGLSRILQQALAF
jgi:2-polyprenyl-6-methoxyphenol hydroxylase-like FAD-dependent oxidoreductase